MTKQTKVKSTSKKNTVDTSDTGLDLREFIQWLRGLHNDCLEYGNTFKDPMKSFYIKAVNSTFFAIGLSFLLFLLMIFGSIFSMQSINDFMHSYDPMITIIIGWAASFVLLSGKKGLKPGQNEVNTGRDEINH